MFISLKVRAYPAVNRVVISPYGKSIFGRVEQVQATFIAEGGPNEPKN
jgi:hypothetical protein